METKEELLEQANGLSKQLDELKKKIENYSETKFEVGKWYHTIRGDKWVVNFTKIEDKYTYFFSIRYDGWKDEEYFLTEKITDFRPATDKEVEEALIAEAKRRGFKEGDIVFRPWFDCASPKKNTLNDWEPSYEEKDDRLQFGGCVVYEKGKWAEIIKEDKIEIGGYEVKFHKANDVVQSKGSSITCWSNDCTIINGNLFTKEFWQAAKVISEHSKAKIMVGCSKQFDVSLETINKILNKLN